MSARRGFLCLTLIAGLSVPLASPARAVTAQRKLEAAIRRNPRNLKLWWKLGVVYFKQKKYTGAAKAWMRVARTKPKLTKVRYLLGVSLFKAKRYDLAALHWQKLLCVDHTHRKARDGLTRLARNGIIDIADVGPARSCSSSRRTPEPDPKPDAEPEDDPDGPKPLPDPEPPKPDTPNVLEGIQVAEDRGKAREAWDQSKRLRKLNQHEKAIESLKEAYKYGYDALEVHYYLGRELLAVERTEEAVYHLEEAKAANADDQTVYLNIGKAHSLDGDTEKEIALYQQALQIDPDYGEAHFMLALAYDKVDNSPKVLEHAQKAIRIDPDYKEKLKPRIKDSNVSKKIGAIVTRVLEDSKYERLTDEKIEEYAEEIGRILGEENLNTEEFMGEGNSQDKVRGILSDVRDGRGREALNRIPSQNRGKFLRVLKKSQNPKVKEAREHIRKSFRK